MNRRNFIWLIVAFAWLESCVSEGKESQLGEQLKDIEQTLLVKSDNKSIPDRLKIIKLKVDSLVSYQSSVHMSLRKDTIVEGDFFEAIIVPGRTYEGEKGRVAAISLQDSTWSITLGDFLEGAYYVKTNRYEKGKNIVQGLVVVGRDTLPVQADFFVR